MTSEGLFPWLKTRSAGALLHPTSLPSNTGVGNWGKGAFKFIDFLKASRVSHWQMCPLGPTGYGDSPYQCFSSFAGNPYLIDWDPFIHSGLVRPDELSSLHALPKNRVDFGELYKRFWPLAKTAFNRWQSAPKSLGASADFGDFCKRHQAWLEPFARFTALKSLNGGKPWWEWPASIRTMAQAEKNGVFSHPQTQIAEAMAFCKFLQFAFFTQFAQVRQHAAQSGVSLIGDVPIFVARDSADAWSSPEYFQFDKNGIPTAVAGVPPDYFSPTGQLWGNPLYRWDTLADDGYAWWMNRLRAAFSLYDIIRLDHFRGFEAYWSVPYGDSDACNGHWEKGPGLRFFKTIAKVLPKAKIIAEDLGLITPGVLNLLSETGLPGMAVLQFAFGGDASNFYLPHNLKPNCAVYTGTHDNDTSRGWYDHADEKTRDHFRRYLRSPGDAPQWDLIHAAYKSVCRLAVVPLQDLLGLGSEARMNTPGSAQGNWQWRLCQEQLAHLNAFIAPNLAGLAEESGRLPNDSSKA